MKTGTSPPPRLAVVVSHPIQYYTPLYQRLAARTDVDLRVFFTWHAGQDPMEDRGFRTRVAWDIPLTSGYEFELVENRARAPGTHHFTGLQNPTLVERVAAWRPDAVHVTGWAWHSHLAAIRAFSRRHIPVLFRGDSHLLDSPQSGWRWWAKRAVLRRVFSLPAAFLVVGAANQRYYEAFGVESERLVPCPHSIDVERFSGPSEELERQATEWRGSLAIDPAARVLLFAGKFERKKQPLELMRGVLESAPSDLILILVGGGELEGDVQALAAAHPQRFRVLPFQNQSRMPLVYRLGELFILPSAFGETWGLAVNEALASGRPALVSDRVGCAPDLSVSHGVRVFPSGDRSAMMRMVNRMIEDRGELSAAGRKAREGAWAFDLPRTEEALVEALRRVLPA